MPSSNHELKSTQTDLQCNEQIHLKKYAETTNTRMVRYDAFTRGLLYDPLHHRNPKVDQSLKNFQISCTTKLIDKGTRCKCCNGTSYLNKLVQPTQTPGEYFHKWCLSWILSTWETNSYTIDPRRLKMLFSDMPALLDSQLFKKEYVRMTPICPKVISTKSRESSIPKAALSNDEVTIYLGASIKVESSETSKIQFSGTMEISKERKPQERKPNTVANDPQRSNQNQQGETSDNKPSQEK